MNIDPNKKSIYKMPTTGKKNVILAHLSLYSYLIFPQAEEHNKKSITLTK